LERDALEARPDDEEVLLELALGKREERGQRQAEK
jgi:hypothetical protein